MLSNSLSPILESSYFKTVVDCFPACIALVSRTGNILYNNKRWSELISHHIQKLPASKKCDTYSCILSLLESSGIDNSVIKKTSDGLKRVVDGSESCFNFECAIGGETDREWFDVTIASILEEPQTSIILLTQITKHKSALERSRIFATLLQLQTGGTRFMLQEPDGSYAIMAMPDKTSEGLAITDADSKILFVNNSLAIMHGYQTQELSGKDVRQILDMDQIKFERLAFPDPNRSEPFDGQLINRRSDGTSFYTMASKRPMASSQLTSGYVWTFHDISKLKQSESELNKRAGELEAKNRQLNCLYQISELISLPRITLAELFTGIVHLIPAATRYPNKIGAVIQFGTETFSAGPVDQKSWERSFEIKVDDKVAATLTLCFASYYQGDETFHVFEDELDLIKAVGDQLGRMIERYGLVAQLEQATGDQLKELSRLELMSGHKSTTISSQAYGHASLRKSQPKEFRTLVNRYQQTLELLLDQKTYKVDHKISDRLRDIASEIGFMRGSPRDVMELHSAAIRGMLVGTPSQKVKAYLTEGKFMAFGILGHLTSFYRNRAIFLTNK